MDKARAAVKVAWEGIRKAIDMSDLPPGFRFFPTDEELVVHFLHRKASCLPCQPDIIPNLDQRLFDPWELNGKALQGGNCQWYFFSHAAGPNRISPSGYWTPVGAKETVTSSGRAVGMKTTLVFYAGQAPEGIKTNWVMHEYQLIDGATSPNSISRSNGKSSSSMRRGSKKRRDLNLVVCRVYETSFFHVEENELSCLDEVFLSLDDMDEISMPK